MYGKRVTWSPVELDYLKKHKADPINQLTIALAKSKSAVQNQLREIKKGTAKPGPVSKKKDGRQRFKIGKRKDCDNLFFRSGWEANVYRWFKHGDLASVEYEPYTFTFFQFGHKSGTTHYIPDFKITDRSGNVKWVEVKAGYMKPQDKTKIRRFKKYYPDEFKKLTFITKNSKCKSAEFFKSQGVPVLAYYDELQSKFSHTIPNWE